MRKATVTITRPDGTQVTDSISLGRPEVLQGSVEGLLDLSNCVYPPFNRCIYCGKTADLRDEHIIPFGLSGTAVLPKASCGHCATITSKFEAQVLRGPMRQVRVLRRLRSRTKHRDAPTTARLTIVRHGVQESVELPIDEYPILLHMPKFATCCEPSEESRTGITVNGMFTISYGPAPEKVLAQLGGESMVHQSGRDQPVSFARMIAKIAYAHAVASGLLEKIILPCPLVPTILGENDEIGRFVGTVEAPIRKYPGLLHRLEIIEDHGRGLLIVAVQLFADSETPTYGVTIGNLVGRKRTDSL